MSTCQTCPNLKSKSNKITSICSNSTALKSRPWPPRLKNNVLAKKEPSGLSWMSLMIPLENFSLVRCQCISADRIGHSNVQCYLFLFSLASFRRHSGSEFHTSSEWNTPGMNHNHAQGFVISGGSWMFHQCLLDVCETEVIFCAVHFVVVEVCLGEYSHRVIQSLFLWGFEKRRVFFWQWKPDSICIYKRVIIPVFLVEAETSVWM